MKLLNGTLRPGRVTEVLENGKIRVDAGGLFSRQDGDMSPEIMPFFGMHSNSFSAPVVGQEVWVMSFTDNRYQLFWFLKDSEHDKHNGDLEKESNVEILCNREVPGGYASIYFSDGSGWMIKNGSNFLQIDKFGNINIKGNKLTFNSKNINMGHESQPRHPAVLGDNLQDMLSDILTTLNAIKGSASCNVYTMPIANAIGNTPDVLAEKLHNITSSSLKITG